MRAGAEEEEEAFSVRVEPEEFDVVVVGTGLVESLVAGAAAKLGKRVLHVDSEAAYGAEWAALGLEEMADLVLRREEGGSAASAASAGVLLSPETVLLPGGEVDVAPEVGPGPHRGFILDRAPKLAHCSGAFVDTLVRSGAYRYVEFKALEGTYVWQDGVLQPVPASRTEVFRDRTLPAGDKRALMKFLKTSMEACDGALVARGEGAASAEWEGHAPAAPMVVDPSEPFARFLERQGLSERLRSVVMYAIAMLDDADGVGAEAGMAAVHQYLTSIGRFGAGQGAFLAPLYGVGELPQAFCRLAAVSGAVYVLRCPIHELELEPESGRVAAVRTAAGQRITCDAVMLGRGSLGGFAADGVGEGEEEGAGDAIVSRAILVTNASLRPEMTQLLTVFPPGSLAGSNTSAIRALQLGSSAGVCPIGHFVIHLSTRASAGGHEGSSSSSSSFARADLAAAAQALVRFGDDAGEDAGEGARPRCVWSAFYRQRTCAGGAPAEARLPPNAAAGAAPDGALGMDAAVRTAEAAFARLFPGEAFFAEEEQASEEAGPGVDPDEAEDEQFLYDAVKNLASNKTDGDDDAEQREGEPPINE
mmetsp:Transcript_26686/g.87507  ORF Transcript_26686/g.87507 Transcript_26686/m.87507 type:complete len:590 (+) Transcript_26686:68-1837(+)